MRYGTASAGQYAITVQHRACDTAPTSWSSGRNFDEDWLVIEPGDLRYEQQQIQSIHTNQSELTVPDLTHGWFDSTPAPEMSPVSSSRAETAAAIRKATMSGRAGGHLTVPGRR